MGVRGKALARRVAGWMAGASADQAARARRALAIVGVLALMVIALSAAERLFLGDASYGSLSAGLGQGESYVGHAWREMLEGEDPGRVLKEGDAFVSDAGDAPAWFAEELFSFDAMDPVMATHDWSVVWIKSQHAPDETLLLVAEELSDSGWRGYESGLENQATFVKEGGSCQWAMVTCTQGEEGTDVVLRLLKTA